jgi:uroporphyrinogen decarboxylase
VSTHFSGPQADGDTLRIIGFCGAPWTLAGYMIEGGKQSGGDHNYIETEKLMYSNGAAWSLLMEIS